jgi:5-methylcytosine-specific restriction protein A
MPTGALRPCAQHGCSNLVLRGVGRCAEHRSERNRIRDAQRHERDRLYDTLSWRRLRLWFLNHYPLCGQRGDGGPEEGCAARGLVVGATDVDHVIALADGGAPLDPSNLRALCHRCHSRRTAREQTGWGRKNVRKSA